MTRSDRYLLAAPAVVLLLVFLIGPLGLLTRVSLYEPASGRGFYEPNTWSLRSYQELLADRTTRAIALFTTTAGLGITILTLLLAYPLAYFVHTLPPRQKAIALTAVLVPKLCNVLVLAYGLQLVLSSAGPISWALVTAGIVREPILLYRNLAGMVIGEVYLLLPYSILLILVGLERIDPALAVAARGLGAGPWQTFWRITWPLSWSGTLAAAELTVLWALAAVLGPLLLGGPEEITLGVEVQRQALEYHRWPRAAALAMVLLALILASLAILFSGKRRVRA